MRGSALRTVALAMGACLIAGGATGAGLEISDKSVSSLGYAFAGQAAAAEDASTVYNNPAGMLQLQGRTLSVGVHQIHSDVRFTDGGSNTSGADRADATLDVVVPNFYYVTDLAPDVRAGFGFNSPFGLGLDYDAEWKGRYDSIHSDLMTFNFSPAIAFRVDSRLAIGASLDFQYLRAELEQAVDLSTVCGAYEGMGVLPAGACAAVTGDATQRLTGDEWSYGFSLGATYDLSAATRLGVVLHSAVRHDVRGDSDFRDVPAPLDAILTDSDGSVMMHLPEMISVSVAHAADERWLLLADYTWTRWSREEELRVKFDNGLPDAVTVENNCDTSRYAVGARYRVNPEWALRVGFNYDQTPTPDAQHRSTRLPDADQRWYTLGANWSPRPGLSVDLTYAYVSVRDIPIDTTDDLGHNLKGRFDVDGSFASVQANVKF